MKNAEGKILPSDRKVFRFVEDIFAFILIIVLTITAIVIKIMQDHMHMQVLNADAILVNLGLVFACIAGIITWREDKHLSLAAIHDKLPPVVRKIIDQA